MADPTRESIKTLNDLIATCRDAEEGFGKAAKGCHDDVLRDDLTRYSGEHGRFATELEDEVRRLGGDPPSSGHLSGIQHRGWRELESSIRPKEDASFVLECVRGEDNTIRHYERALDRDLPAPLHGKLQGHLRRFRAIVHELNGNIWLRKAS